MLEHQKVLKRSRSVAIYRHLLGPRWGDALGARRYHVGLQQGALGVGMLGRYYQNYKHCSLHTSKHTPNSQLPIYFQVHNS